MRRIALPAALALAAGFAAAQTVDDVVSRYLEARGGLDRLRAVRSLRMTGRLRLPDLEAPLVLELKRPHKMRTVFTIEGRESVRAFDGQTAWVLPPVPGATPQLMPPDQAAEARAQADVDLSPLVDSKAKGFTLELAGRESLPGGETWKIVVRGGPGAPRTFFLDVSTHHVVRTEDLRELDGREVEFVSEVSDYRTVDGLVYPHRIRSGPKGRPEEWQQIEIDTIEVNPALDDARFTMPGGAPPR